MQRASLRWPQFVLPREQAVKLAESCLEFTGKKVFPDVEIKIKGEFGQSVEWCARTGVCQGFTDW